jgi:hypothetical protein
VSARRLTLFVKPKIMKRMKLKLPILVGGLFILLSLPFIFGFLQPSIHEGGYSALYVILNMPALIAVSGIGQKIESALLTNPNLYNSNIVSIALLFLFWVVLSFVLGSIFDKIKRKERARRA